MCAQLPRYRCGATYLIVPWILLLLGCQLVPQRTDWREASVAAPQLVARPLLPDSPDELQLLDAQERYAEAARRERQGDSRCVDLYFQVAAGTWPLTTRSADMRILAQAEAVDLHYSALVKTLTTAQEYGRWNSQTGLTVQVGDTSQIIPVAYRGFVWRPEDFHVLIPAGPYRSTNLTNVHGQDGVGVPLVVVRHRPIGQRFVPDRSVFAATVVLRPHNERSWSSLGAMPRVGSPPLVIELSDPLRAATTSVNGTAVPLASDLTAPIAFQLGTMPRTWWTDFIRPAAPTGDQGLHMLEPYQPGKIPVIFIHGLLSDPFTWAEMLNELRAQPDIVSRYQFWAFEYATGQPFLTSAARLRTELPQLRQCIDPYGQDAALSRIVLVGHSMGGLVAKLQISQSNDIVWRTVANQPFDSLRANAEQRERLARALFFLPSPDVSRVVFIGTPHRGSTEARRALALLASSLVEPTSEQQVLHQQLVQDNPGVFSLELAEGIPTSIDLLNPESQLLQSILTLPIQAGVTLHSIIGDGRWSLLSGPGDGVVPVSSAEFPGAATTRYVPALHTFLTSDPEVIAEVAQILRRHQ